MRRAFILTAGILIVLIIGFAYWCNAGPAGMSRFALPAGTKQALAVVWKLGPDGSQVPAVTVWESGPLAWTQVEGPIPCVIGRNGIGPPGQKREGDGRTPTGMFRIGLAFGSEPQIDTKLNYRQATADDFWVDDPDSPQYNRWVHGRPDAKSFEKLLIDDYKYAAVIEYNTEPVVPGKGSAIFLHVWEGENRATSGCVAVQEANMKYLLAWLDKSKNPVIVIAPGPESR